MYILVDYSALYTEELMYSLKLETTAMVAWWSDNITDTQVYLSVRRWVGSVL